MNILITGATGFLGSHLVRALLQRGDNVLAYRRQSSSLERLRDVAEQIRWFDIDVDGLARPFKDDREIDVIIHAATSYGRSGESTAELVEANVLLPLRLTELAKIHGRPLFLNIDSFFTKAGASYRNAPRYAVTKKHVREWLETDIATVLAVRNFRLEHVYGPHDRPHKFIPAILSALSANQPRLALTLGEQRRDFIYVTDVVAALLCVLENTPLDSGAGFAEFEVGRGESIPVRTMVEAAKRILGSKTDLGFGDLPYVQGEIMHSEANIQPLQALGWSAAVSLEQGIRETVKGCISEL